MVSIRAHFDGKVIVPEEPLTLPLNEPLVVHIQKATEEATPSSALDWLADHAIDSDACPADLARHHDHYLYGSAKRDAPP